MRLGEVAAVLSVHVRSVQRMIKAGMLEAVRVPYGGRRVRESDVLRLVPQLKGS